MDKNLLQKISVDSNILHGKPRIKGTRIAVSMVTELLAAGYSPKEICSKQFYPDLKIDDVLACLAFANQFFSQKEIRPLKNLKDSSKN